MECLSPPLTEMPSGYSVINWQINVVNVLTYMYFTNLLLQLNTILIDDFNIFYQLSYIASNSEFCIVINTCYSGIFINI